MFSCLIRDNFHVHFFLVLFLHGFNIIVINIWASNVQVRFDFAPNHIKFVIVHNSVQSPLHEKCIPCKYI